MRTVSSNKRVKSKPWRHEESTIGPKTSSSETAHCRVRPLIIVNVRAHQTSRCDAFIAVDSTSSSRYPAAAKKRERGHCEMANAGLLMPARLRVSNLELGALIGERLVDSAKTG